ncbi:MULTISPECIES: hypothetical protein [unclassified Sphingomonas]|uniref:hypothetical protein n=1 Tax=unclassified Sphingomonas TaxID=196159 RepID=UPI000B17B331|nr:MULTISPECIES: hypothetical protein [unclassified Sphingomonas]
MTTSDYPETAPGKPLWLMTLADLALLLVGFLVLVQASQHLGARDLAKGIRKGFGANVAEPTPMPVAAAGMLDFAPGSAIMPTSPGALVAWAREAGRDPRMMLTVTGSTDGTPADVDPTTGSAAILAADRARAVAAALSAVAPSRVTIVTTTKPGRRAAIVSLAFVGEPQKTAPMQKIAPMRTMS